MPPPAPPATRPTHPPATAGARALDIPWVFYTSPNQLTASCGEDINFVWDTSAGLAIHSVVEVLAGEANEEKYTTQPLPSAPPRTNLYIFFSGLQAMGTGASTCYYLNMISTVKRAGRTRHHFSVIRKAVVARVEPTLHASRAPCTRLATKARRPLQQGRLHPQLLKASHLQCWTCMYARCPLCTRRFELIAQAGSTHSPGLAYRGRSGARTCTQAPCAAQSPSPCIALPPT